jgi:hypothetical protein
VKRFLPIGSKVVLPDGSGFVVDATEVDGVTVTARPLGARPEPSEEVIESRGC